MSEALLVSNALLWLAVVVLGVVVLVLTRQIGLLHERIAPVGALAHASGPEVGEPAPELALRDLSGRPVRVGGAQPGARTLLFFLSPDCPVCKTLVPTLRRLLRDEPDLRLVLASDGAPEEAAVHDAFRRAMELGEERYVLSTELGLRYRVSRLPTAVLIDAEGIVRAQGMVNTREHLESLLAADELGVASLQEYARREGSGPRRAGGIS